MQSVKSAMPQSSYKEHSKSAVTQSTHLDSMSKTARKQIGTQPEVMRNHQDSTSNWWYPPVSTNVCPDPVKMQSNHSPDSRSYKMQNHHMQSLNPGKMLSNYMQPVEAELKKLQVNARSWVQTSKCKRDTKPQALSTVHLS